MFDKRLFSLSPGAMKYIVIAVVWMWLGLLGDILLIYGIAILVGAMFAGAPLPLQTSVLCCLAALALKAASSHNSITMKFRASSDVKRSLREQLYEKLLRMGPSYTRDATTAEVVQMSVDGTEQLETYFGQYIPQLIYALLAPLTLFAVIAPINLPTAIVLLVFVPMIPLVIGLIQGIARRLLGKYLDQYLSLGDNFLENLQGLTTLKIYQADEARHKAMNEEAERFRVITMKVLRMQLNSIIVMDIVALGGAAAGIIVCLFALNDGLVSFQDFLFVALLSSSFFVPMRQLGSYFHVAMNGMASSKKIFRILDLPEPADKPNKPQTGDTFTMQDVSFSYDEEREILHRVSIAVPEHGLCGVVGPSGSGKSTIALLLSGADDNYSGSLRLGNNEVNTIDPKSLAQYITYVGLGSYLFRGTVRDNLLLAKPNATDDEMWKVLDRCALGDFMRAQEGLDTKLEGEASNLSGGQRQRLALARALLHDTPVFVFDEATSNIDIESEEAIMTAVDELSRDHAVVCISHRLANVTDADVIYVLDEGSVVGTGTHSDLLSSCETYKTLWENQVELERYRSEEASHEAK